MDKSPHQTDDKGNAARSMRPKGIISLADLVTLQAMAENPEQQRLLAQAIGYEYRPLEPEKEGYVSLEGGHLNVDKELSQIEVVKSVRSPIQHWYVQSYRGKERTPEPKSKDSTPVGVEKSPNVSLPPAIRPEINPGLMQGWLDRLLKVSLRGQQIDLLKVVDSLSKNKPLRGWPLTTRVQDVQELVVVLDFHDHLAPLLNELRLLNKRLYQFLGAQGRLLIALADHTPPTALLQSAYSRMLPEQSRVLLLSDMGANGDDRLMYQWQSLVTELKKEGHSVRVFSPCPLPVSTAQVVKEDETVILSAAANEQRVLALVCAMAFCHYPTTSTLRYLRQQLPRSNPADELSVWNHGDAKVSSGQWELHRDKRKQYRTSFSGLPKHLKDPLLKALNQWQLTLCDETRGIEAGLMYEYGLRDTPPPAEWFRALIQRSEPYDPNLLTLGDTVLYYAMELLCELNRLKQSTDHRPLFERAQPIARNARLPLPLEPQGGNGQTLCFNQKKNALAIDESPLGVGCIHQTAIDLMDEVTRKPLVAGGQFESSPLVLCNEQRRITLDRLEKPRWAQSLGRDEHGLVAIHEGGGMYQLVEAGPDRQDASWHCIKCPSWCSESGVDAFGLYASLDVSGVLQTFRWIPHGAFLMGSPEGEYARGEDEVQHSVRLTQGVWLADTACTQALWQAVTGENPSHFSHASDAQDRPVEQVSWADCQRMLEQFNQKVPGVNLRLPTEAEWEYACRAGTTTPFSFGENITTAQVNFYGGNPYRDGEKGIFREETVTVKSLPANSWGLYQMHGNVLEWCSDWYHAGYENEEPENPKGPDTGADRDLRGGSWFGIGRDVRSACRFRYSPDYRDDCTGLRLARGELPQAKSSQAQVVSDEAVAEQAERVPQREAASWFERLIKRNK